MVAHFNKSIPPTNFSKTLKGMFHIHSNFSFDGHNSIEEIVTFLKARDYNFICLTEHSDDFDKEKMHAFLKDCQKVSCSDFLVIPGIEYRCTSGVHLIVIGSKIFYNSDNLLSIAEKASKENALTIIAHPCEHKNTIDTTLIKLIDGVEIWNGQKDSRFIPHYNSFRIFKNYEKNNPNLIALGGTDLHNLNNYYPIDLLIPDCPLDQSSIIANLRRGSLHIEGKYCKIKSPNPSPLSLLLFFFGRNILNLLRTIRNILKQKQAKPNQLAKKLPHI